MFGLVCQNVFGTDWHGEKYLIEFCLGNFCYGKENLLQRKKLKTGCIFKHVLFKILFTIYIETQTISIIK
jgi:hypothetical protein